MIHEILEIEKVNSSRKTW